MEGETLNLKSGNLFCASVCHLLALCLKSPNFSEPHSPLPLDGENGNLHDWLILVSSSVIYGKVLCNLKPFY